MRARRMTKKQRKRKQPGTELCDHLEHTVICHSRGSQHDNELPAEACCEDFLAGFPHNYFAGQHFQRA